MTFEVYHIELINTRIISFQKNALTFRKIRALQQFFLYKSHCKLNPKYLVLLFNFWQERAIAFLKSEVFFMIKVGPSVTVNSFS